MGRRILNRKELRADFDEAERNEDEEVEDEDDDDDDEDDDEKEDEDEEAEEEVKPKRKRKAPATTTKRRTRSRAAKVVRMKVVWGVFDNSNKCVAKYDYKNKADAEAHADKLTASKTNNTHFVNPIKEPIEEETEEK